MECRSESIIYAVSCLLYIALISFSSALGQSSGSRTVDSLKYEKFYANATPSAYSTVDRSYSEAHCSSLCRQDSGRCSGFSLTRVNQIDVFGKCQLYEGIDGVSVSTTSSSSHHFRLYLLLDNTDCQAIWGRGVRDAGVYELQLEYSNGTKLAANAWCEFDDQHGWTVIQRRLDSNTDFWQYWDDFKWGFGELSSSHWLGNEYLHLLTQKNVMVKAALEMINGTQFEASFARFQVGDANSLYQLPTPTGFQTSLSGCNDTRAYLQRTIQFSTRDQDNDGYGGAHCAEHHKGGWWYYGCLNQAFTTLNDNAAGFRWRCCDSAGCTYHPLQQSTIMVTRNTN